MRKELNIEAIKLALSKFIDSLTVEEVESWIKEDVKQKDYQGRDVVYVECDNFKDYTYKLKHSTTCMCFIQNEDTCYPDGICKSCKKPSVHNNRPGNYRVEDTV